MSVDVRRAEVMDREALFIGGNWVAPGSQERFPVVDAATEQPIGSVPSAGTDDVRRAVQAARAAFDGWSAIDPAARARLLDVIADGLEARTDQLARTITAEVGMPLKLTRAIQVGLPVASFRTAAEIARTYPFDDELDNSLIVREPIGVVAAITPWNYPLHQVVCKVAPALAAGCSVVLKASEVAPLSAFILADVIEAAGLPAGVFNVLTGPGDTVGEPLVADPDVDMISFTGSTAVGKRVSAVASSTVKRVALELGGKSPNVILPDADLERAVTHGVANAFLNSGQTCTALTRMLVAREHLARAEEIAVASCERFAPGDPFAEGTRMGPLASAAQRDRVRGYIDAGVREGAKLLTGGVDVPTGCERGYYVRPTVFSEVTPDMRIAREEIFGPVLAIQAYDDEDDAVRLANDTPYGLAGAVWSGDPQRAERIARRLRAGQVDINGGRFNPRAPFGGYKQSGNGRESGRFGFEEFLEVKALQR
ncbi:MAG: aldehyde dehydrogenase family protein [Chthonomonadaceae bacterium]|nr:aldehyde dehydrogenase family protein [Chthonomonadaceae bacterium]